MSCLLLHCSTVFLSLPRFLSPYLSLSPCASKQLVLYQPVSFNIARFSDRQKHSGKVNPMKRKECWTSSKGINKTGENEVSFHRWSFVPLFMSWFLIVRMITKAPFASGWKCGFLIIMWCLAGKHFELMVNDYLSINVERITTVVKNGSILQLGRTWGGGHFLCSIQRELEDQYHPFFLVWGETKGACYER